MLWGIPSFIKLATGLSNQIASLASYGMFILLLGFYLISKKEKPLIIFVILGLLYFVISALSFIPDFNDYMNKFVKYIILIICGAELARQTTKKEFFIFCILGACSVLAHALLFQDDYGRYSGFYINPNGAGFICIIGYCLSFAIASKKLKLFGQLVLTLAGILTFSRTFIGLWLLVSLISVISNKRNSINFGLGLGAMIFVISLASFLQLNTVRLSAFESILNDNPSSGISTIQEGGRLETWSVYYDMILDKPIFGNGYELLSGFDETQQGVHNSFLKILGEAGIFPFLLFVGIYFYMFKKSLSTYKTKAHHLMLSITLIGILMIMHNYFDNNLILFTSLWLYVSLMENGANKSEELTASTI